VRLDTTNRRSSALIREPRTRLLTSLTLCRLSGQDADVADRSSSWPPNKNRRFLASVERRAFKQAAFAVRDDDARSTSSRMRCSS